KAFEEDTAKRSRHTGPIEPGRHTSRGVEQILGLLKDFRLVVEGLEATRSEDRLVEPFESEQEEEDADDSPRVLNRHPRRDRDPERRDQDREPDKREGH